MAVLCTRTSNKARRGYKSQNLIPPKICVKKTLIKQINWEIVNFFSLKNYISKIEV